MALRWKVLKPADISGWDNVFAVRLGDSAVIEDAQLQVFVRTRDANFDEAAGECGYWEAVPVVRR